MCSYRKCNCMKNRELFTKDKETFAALTLSQKAGFLCDYYKWYILIPLFIVVSAVATFIYVSSSNEVVLSGYLFDSYYTSDHDEPFHDFSSYAQLDTNKQRPEFLTNLTLYGLYSETSQQLYSTIAAKQTDFLASNPQTFLRLSYDSFKYLADLRNVLSEQQLEQLSNRLFYVDASMVGKLDSQVGTVYLPDPHDPSAMDDPVPVGINIRGGRGVDKLYLGEDPVYLAIVSNAPHLDMTRIFIDFLLSENE